MTLIKIPSVSVGSSVQTSEIDDGAITEVKLSMSDNTTKDSSTSAHGLLPKLDNVSTNFLDGTGSFSAPVGAKDKTIFTMPIMDIDGSSTVYTKVITGTGSASLSDSSIEIATGSTDGSKFSAILKFVGGNAPNLAYWDNNPSFGTELQFNSIAGDADVWHAIGGVNNDRPDTEHHVGFHIKMTSGTPVFNATNAGGTQTITDLEITWVVNTPYFISWVMISGTNIKFYVDSVLKATHTTNLPTTENGNMFTFGVDNEAGTTTSRIVKFGLASFQWDTI